MLPDGRARPLRPAGRAARPAGRRPARAAAAALVVGLVAVLGACSGEPDEGADDAIEPSAPSAPSVPAVPGEAVEYRPGRAATILRPDGGPASVVVLVPGGGWTTADPAGMAPLAQVLADHGHAVVTITYGVQSTGDAYPTPLLDAACAVGLAAEEVPDVPVVVLGHSAGAQLAALTALSPRVNDPARALDPQDPCPSPASGADAVVGVAGPYDIASAGGLAEALVGVPQTQDPDLWTEANPVTWVDERPDVPFLLVHGDADGVVPVWFSERFGQALLEAGHEVDLVVLPDVNHSEVYQPDALADPLLDWLSRTVPDLGAAG